MRNLPRGAALVAVALLLALGTSQGQAVANGTTFAIGDLVAGQHTLVGNVTVTFDGDELVVEYFVTEAGWCLTETHLYVGTCAPPKSAPGQFPYAHDPLSCTYDEYVVPIEEDTCYYVAAHAVVQTFDADGTTVDLEAFCDMLPSTADLTVSHPGSASYFTSTLTNADWLSGTYEGWCIDADRFITPGTTYGVGVLCSYDAGAASLVEYPENLDLMNYVLNQHYVGKDAGSGLGTFTYGDVQAAIWSLIEDNLSGGLGDWSQDRVDVILADAYANGEGYEPGCGDYLAVILVPYDQAGAITAQVTIIAVPLLCERDETAWAWGTGTWKTGWGMYEEYCP